MFYDQFNINSNVQIYVTCFSYKTTLEQQNCSSAADTVKN